MMVSPRENFETHLAALETCTSHDVSTHVMAILESFPFSTREEQAEYSNKVSNLALQHAADKPLLFYYARFVQGFFAFYSENFTDAIELLTEAQGLFEEYHDINGAAICTGVMGGINRTMGYVEISLRMMLAAYEQVKSNETYQMIAMAMGVGSANLYVEQKHFEEANRLYKAILEMPPKWFSFYWVVYVHHGMGKMCMAQGNPTEARQHFEEAMDIAEKNNHPLSVCNSLSELGNYYHTLGDDAQAERYHLSALQKREANNFFSGAITSCITLGSIYIKQSRFDDALKVLEKGMKMAEQIKVKLKLYNIHRLLSEIYELQGNLQESLDHYKKYHQFQSEVEAEDSARKVKNVQMLIQAEQTKKENIIIKKQKAEIEKKNQELQEKIDELTRARINKKARAITFSLAIILFVAEDPILHLALNLVPRDSYWLSLFVKMVIIFSLSPVNRAIERHLLKRIMKKKQGVATIESSSGIVS